VSAGANAQVAVRQGHLQLRKEDFGHGGIVVLAGVNERLMNAEMRSQRAQHWRRLDEIRTRTHDMKNVHGEFGEIVSHVFLRMLQVQATRVSV
jgi:hypothetical protein